MSILIAFVLALAEPPPRTVPLRTVGRLTHGPIRECSGIVASRRHPGVFWVHNDSGNPPRLFAIQKDGTLLREYSVSVPNVDWEDIAIDNDGHLFLGDIGNNDHRLPLRAIYRFVEPDPRLKLASPSEIPTLRPDSAIYYRFGPEGRFDAEGMAIASGQAFLVSKRLDGKDAEVFGIRLDPPATLLRPATPTSLGPLPGFRRPATGADLHPDGRLAVCSTGEVAVFTWRSSQGWSRIGGIAYRDTGDVEAVCWDGDDLVLASEGREIYRVPEEVWRGPSPRRASENDRSNSRRQATGNGK